MAEGSETAALIYFDLLTGAEIKLKEMHTSQK